MKNSLALLSLMLALAACGSSAEPDYYALDSVAGGVAPLPPFIIKIDRPVIPAFLDRPQFVTQDGNHRLSIDDADHWAEPVDSMIERNLADDLQQRLPASTVVTEQDKTPADTRFILSINLERFNADDDGNALLQGVLFVKDNNAAIQPPPIPFQGRVDCGSSPANVADGLSRLLAAFADQITGALAAYAAQPPMDETGH